MNALQLLQDSFDNLSTEIPSSFDKNNKNSTVQDHQALGSYPGLQQPEAHFALCSSLPAINLPACDFPPPPASSQDPSGISTAIAYPSMTPSPPTLTTPPIMRNSSSKKKRATTAPKGKKEGKTKSPAQRKSIPTKCPRCPRMFSCHSDMKRHRLSEHDGVRFQCPHCPGRRFSYTRFDALQRHDNSKHLGIDRPAEVREPGAPKESPGPRKNLLRVLRTERAALTVQTDKCIVQTDERTSSRAERAERRAANKGLEV